MLKFPMKFQVEATASQSSQEPWSSKGENLPPIASAIPVEFAGPGGGYSPEDFFALALLNCLIATYKVYAEKEKISFEKVLGKAILTVDRVAGQPGFIMTHIDLFIDVQKSSDPNKGKEVLEKAIKDCAVSNSIKAGKTFHLTVS